MKTTGLLLSLVIMVSTPTVNYAAPEKLIIEDELKNERRVALSKIDILACLDSGGVIKSVCMLGVPACMHI